MLSNRTCMGMASPLYGLVCVLTYCFYKGQFCYKVCNATFELLADRTLQPKIRQENEIFNQQKFSIKDSCAYNQPLVFKAVMESGKSKQKTIL